MTLRIEPGIRILQQIDKISETNFITVVVFNKQRKRLIQQMRAIKPCVPLDKEKKFFSLIRPRGSQNLLGEEVTFEEREEEDKRVRYNGFFKNHYVLFGLTKL